MGTMTLQAGERALIAGILDQAVSDAVSRKRCNDFMGAIRFIDDKNPLFCYYCELLDLEPEYVARKMHEKIQKNLLRPLKQFRE